MSEVTRMLEHAQSGDLKAAEDLLSLLQEELRELVALKMADQRPPSTPCNPQPFYTKPTCAWWARNSGNGL